MKFLGKVPWSLLTTEGGLRQFLFDLKSTHPINYLYLDLTDGDPTKREIFYRIKEIGNEFGIAVDVIPTWASRWN